MESKIPGSSCIRIHRGISDKHELVRIPFAFPERTSDVFEQVLCVNANAFVSCYFVDLMERNPTQKFCSTKWARFEGSQRLKRYKPVRLATLLQDVLPEHQCVCAGPSKTRKCLWADNTKIKAKPTVVASKLARRTQLLENATPRTRVTFSQTIFASPKPKSLLEKSRKSKCDSDCSHKKETVELIKHRSIQMHSSSPPVISASPKIDLSDSLREFMILENTFKSPMSIKSATNTRIPALPNGELYQNLLAEVQELRARIEILERKERANAALDENENVIPTERKCSNLPRKFMEQLYLISETP